MRCVRATIASSAMTLRKPCKRSYALLGCPAVVGCPTMTLAYQEALTLKKPRYPNNPRESKAKKEKNEWKLCTNQ